MSSRLEALMQADPEAARKLLMKLAGKLVVPHAAQQEIFESQKRFQVVCCGRRFGKTVVAAKKALVRTRKSNQMVWWVAPTYKVVKRGYREVLRQLPDGVLTHAPPQESAFDAGRSVVLKFKNGSRMEFYSAERPEGMLGEGVDLAILDEAATMPKGVWEQIVRPTLMDRQGHALMISTPRGRNWFYYLWLRGQKEEYPDYDSWRFPTSANPFIAPSEIEDMRAELPLVIFQQEVLAEFISSAGAVFRYDEKIITRHVKPEGHVVVGVDLAKSVDFTVLSAARASDGLPCGFDRFNEISWPQQRNRIKSFVKRLRDNGATHVMLCMDATGVGDPNVEEMEIAGYDVLPINFTKTKQYMVMQLAKDLEDGKAWLSPNYIEEFENYTYKVTDAGRFTYSAPEGQHDDVVSAKLLQHWAITQEGTPNIVSVSADDETDTYEDEDDWSDLIDEIEQDTGIPEVKTFTPDSPQEIMQRASAWSGVASVGRHAYSFADE